MGKDRRQRIKKGYYDTNPTLSPEEQESLFKNYARRHELKIKNKTVKRLNK